VIITTTPVPEEKDFRGYILVFPGNMHPPIYTYLSKPPVELLEVKLYSDFDGRSRQGELEIDHIPSAAAKAHYKRLHPELSPKELKSSLKGLLLSVCLKEYIEMIVKPMEAETLPKR